MILPDFILPSRVNQQWQYSGLDSAEKCLDKSHFNKYPHSISYQYNSRGFRDSEWPTSTTELEQSIWCIGDSFTVGLGSPVEHTWPYLLAKKTGRKVINVSMDGASNNWIARRALSVQKEISPSNIAIMWSYLHRREHENQNIDDEQRRIYTVSSDYLEDSINFLHCVNMIKTSNVIQLVIPDYAPVVDDCQEIWNTVRGPDWPQIAPRTLDEMQMLPTFVQSELKGYLKVWEKLQTIINFQTIIAPLDSNLIKVNRLDLARDGHHFDLITAQWIVDQLVDDLIL